MTRMPFEIGVTHYDAPPPDVIDDVDILRIRDAFRFANELRAWIDVEDGHVVGHGQEGGGMIGSTRVRLGPMSVAFAAVRFPDRRPAPLVTETSVRFTQTAGGRTGVPAPRRVKYPPFVQFHAPTVWTTLSLTIHADGRSTNKIVGASPFPRHWVYDRNGRLMQKAGLIDFTSWFEKAFGTHTPWGDEESPALATEVETALERQLSRQIMGGASPRITRLEGGQTLVEQGAPARELFLLLDGLLSVEVNAAVVAQLGPGAVVGERGLLEGGKRTATLRAITRCRVAVATTGQIAPAALAVLAASHHREEI